MSTGRAIGHDAGRATDPAAGAVQLPGADPVFDPGAATPPVPSSRRRRLLLVAATVALAGPARAETSPPGTSAPGSVGRPARRQTALPAAADLSARAGVRHLVLFSVTNCPWCEIVRAKHLRHRVESRRGDIRIAVSEVMIDRDAAVIGPDGQPSSGRELARRLGVRVGPTVLAFDAAGRPVGEPLVGALLEDFYEAYVDRLVDQAVGPGN